MKQQLSGCLRTMPTTDPSTSTEVTMSKNTAGWVPEQEPEPGTEVKSGDLYLLSGPVVDDAANNNKHSKHSDKSGSFARNNCSNRSNVNSNNTASKKRPSKIPVHVKVYKSCFGHYAVVTASLRAPATYLNLKSCNCRPCDTTTKTSNTLTTPFTSTFSSSSSLSSARSFRVELGGGEGQVIYFEVSSRDKEGVESWVRAFQGATAPPSPGNISPSLSPIIPRSPIMPTLQESIEEEDEEEEEEKQRVNDLG